MSSLPSVEILFFDGFDGFDELDAVGPWEVLAAAGFDVRAVGFPGGGERVTAANGLIVHVDGTLGDAPDLVVVPGGGWVDGSATGVRSQVTTEATRLLAALHDRGTVMASVCTGAMLLAAAGILDGRPVVTNRSALDDLAATGADVRRDARVVDDGDVVTCGGPLAGIDLGIRLVERYRGPEAGERAARRLEHTRVGPLVVTAGVR